MKLNNYWLDKKQTKISVSQVDEIEIKDERKSFDPCLTSEQMICYLQNLSTRQNKENETLHNMLVEMYKENEQLKLDIEAYKNLYFDAIESYKKEIQELKGQ